MNCFRRPPAVWAWVARPDAVDIELVRYAILSRVGAFIDKAVIANLAPQRLHSLFVTLRRCSDEVIWRQSHPLPKLAKLCRNLVGELLWRLARSLGRPFDLLTVLVRARKKPRVFAQHPVPPRDHVAGERRVGMPDMRMRVNVIDRSRNIELLLHLCRFTSVVRLHVRLNNVQLQKTFAELCS